MIKRSHILALTFWVLLALVLIVEDIVYARWAQTTWFAFSTTIGLTALALGWVLAHAKENGVKTSMGLNVTIVAIAVVAIPYYRFRYFGAKSGFKFIAWVLIAFAALIAVLTLVDGFINS